MIDPAQLRSEVIDPTLDFIGLYTRAASNLVLGTGLVESRLKYLKQIGGPALGLWQMEPATHEDIRLNFLPKQPKLYSRILQLRYDWVKVHPLVGSLPYACAMCRVLYWRSPVALPGESDAQGLAQMWKTVYNTALGAGRVEQALPFFQEAIQT